MSLQQARDAYERAVTNCNADRMDIGYVTAPRRAALSDAWTDLYRAIVDDYASGVGRDWPFEEEPIGGSLAARPLGGYEKAS